MSEHNNSSEQPLVIALGGNALKAGASHLDYPALPKACKVMATYADKGLLVTHGNGPQIGKLLESSDSNDRRLDGLGAETEGLLGYVIEQELANQMAVDDRIATLLTRTEVNRQDKALNTPVKPVGQWLGENELNALSREEYLAFQEDNGKYRRLVPSPKPLRTLQLDVIRSLIREGFTVVCAGGGGIPVIRDHQGTLHGLDAVIDKDLTSSLLATELGARKLVLATNVGGVYRDWDTGAEDLIRECRPEELESLSLPDGSMAPKADAACDFVRKTGSPAAIGHLDELEDLIAGNVGTQVHE